MRISAATYDTIAQNDENPSFHHIGTVVLSNFGAPTLPPMREGTKRFYGLGTTGLTTCLNENESMVHAQRVTQLEHHPKRGTFVPVFLSNYCCASLYTTYKGPILELNSYTNREPPR